MRIAVLHHSLNPMGGGERLCLVTIEAFKERGWEVVLATVEPTDWARVSQLWGRTPRPDREITLSIPLKGFTIYKRLLSSFMVPVLRKRVDVVINTHGDVLVTNADITYMHFPTFALWDWTYHKYEHGFWRMYFTPYYFIEKKLVERHVDTLLLTNSRFSASVIRRVFGRKALVLYPPVDVEKFAELDGERRECVVTVGRFSPEKNYELVLEIAEKLRHITFYIVGSVSGGEGRMYYEKIRRFAEDRELKNVVLVPNASDKELARIFSTCRVYLHAMVNEHFGISVVEGMAAGLVPVVHRSGGPWTDIVDRGKYGYGYSNISEAVEMIMRAVNNYKALKPYVRRRAQLFSKEKFKEKIVRVVEKYA